jgi:hypothetical protein
MISQLGSGIDAKGQSPIYREYLLPLYLTLAWFLTAPYTTSSKVERLYMEKSFTQIRPFSAFYFAVYL